MVTSILPPIDCPSRSGWAAVASLIATVLILLFCTSCAGYRGVDQLQGEVATYRVKPETSAIRRFAPLFLVEDNQLSYNRPGAPYLFRTPGGGISASVDPQRPTIYFQETEFLGAHGTYRNLIYRLHFREVPSGHLTSGRNAGLVIVVTLDDQGRPLLYTTVHTCGCYLAIIPTSHLPERALPSGWNQKQQKVYGEVLPGLLRFPAEDKSVRLLITLRSGSHRIMDLRLITEQDLQAAALTLLPVSTLRHLPLNGETASFFEEEGARRGYVRDSRKIWERLLISWWALDARVGEDKDLGPSAETGTVFYTSLKPWAREASDLWRFQTFLTYWGWNL